MFHSTEVHTFIHKALTSKNIFLHPSNKKETKDVSTHLPDVYHSSNYFYIHSPIHLMEFQIVLAQNFAG